MNADVLVIGGGAAGLMAAGTAAERGFSVCLVEKNAVLGKKIRITGKGRCNVTNDCDVRTLIDSIPTNGKFLYSAATRFSPRDTMQFFEKLGLPLKTERGNRVFPQSDHAADVAEALRRYAVNSGVQIRTGEVRRLLMSGGAVHGVELTDGIRLEADGVVVCCGGLSYPGTGSTGDGYRLAKQAGHTVTELRPSLVPLIARGDDCREMMGLSLKNIAIRVLENPSGKVIYEDFGEMLFTHFGLSGPVILSASAHMRDMSPGKYRVCIDLKPALSPEKLDLRLLRELETSKNRDFIHALDSLLPRKMIPVAVRRSGIGAETKCNLVTREQRHSLGTLLKSFEVEVEAFRPVAEAVVTSGGVAASEIDPKTMKSKIAEGLYFAGEVLDVDAYTGGFNLQIAFSTGRLAGNSIPKREEPTS